MATCLTPGMVWEESACSATFMSSTTRQKARTVPAMGFTTPFMTFMAKS